jgi:hypothetical protein
MLNVKKFGVGLTTLTAYGGLSMLVIRPVVPFNAEKLPVEGVIVKDPAVGPKLMLSVEMSTLLLPLLKFKVPVSKAALPIAGKARQADMPAVRRKRVAKVDLSLFLFNLSLRIVVKDFRLA